MNHDASPLKRAATEAYGATVVSEGIDHLGPRRGGRRGRGRARLRLIHPFDDWDVISGQATATLELIEDAPPLDAVVTPLGGGGLLSGAALACAQLSPSTPVWGAEPAGGPGRARSLAEGRLVRLDAVPETIADGARTVAIGTATSRSCASAAHGIHLVDDDALRQAVALSGAARRSRSSRPPVSASPRCWRERSRGAASASC